MAAIHLHIPCLLSAGADRVFFVPGLAEGGITLMLLLLVLYVFSYAIPCLVLSVESEYLITATSASSLLSLVLVHSPTVFRP